MEAKATAQRVKDFLIELAINDNLPTDLNNLPLDGLVRAIEGENPAYREAIEKARGLLCDNDELSSDGVTSIEKQVELIAKQADIDGTELIDNVEGVIVWQKVEGSYTCDDFLSDIGY